MPYTQCSRILRASIWWSPKKNKASPRQKQENLREKNNIYTHVYGRKNRSNVHTQDKAAAYEYSAHLLLPIKPETQNITKTSKILGINLRIAATSVRREDALLVVPDDCHHEAHRGKTRKRDCCCHWERTIYIVKFETSRKARNSWGEDKVVYGGHDSRNHRNLQDPSFSAPVTWVLRYTTIICSILLASSIYLFPSFVLLSSLCYYSHDTASQGF